MNDGFTFRYQTKSRNYGFTSHCQMKSGNDGFTFPNFYSQAFLTPWNTRSSFLFNLYFKCNCGLRFKEKNKEGCREEDEEGLEL